LKAARTSDPGADEETTTMTPQDVVSLAPPRGFLMLVALVLTAMASCFWTAETDVETELVKHG
jgi:ABC-type uncharacterized transport system permease subunit